MTDAIIAPQLGIGPTRPRTRDAYESARVHATRRLLERYGLAITPAEYERLCNQVRAKRKGPSPTGPINADATAPDGTPVYRISVRGVLVWAAWNPRLKIIGTFYVLP
jgi:hypothetical protein